MALKKLSGPEQIVMFECARATLLGLASVFIVVRASKHNPDIKHLLNNMNEFKRSFLEGTRFPTGSLLAGDIADEFHIPVGMTWLGKLERLNFLSIRMLLC